MLLTKETHMSRDESCLSVPLYSKANLNLVREVDRCPPSFARKMNLRLCVGTWPKVDKMHTSKQLRALLLPSFVAPELEVFLPENLCSGAEFCPGCSRAARVRGLRGHAHVQNKKSK